MHEASIVAGIMKIIEEEAQRHAVAHISRVHLQVGLLTAVEPRTLAACFELYSEETVAEGAKLELEIMPMHGNCNDCGSAFELTRRHFLCPHCASQDVVLRGGRELTIAGLDVQQPQGATA